MLKEYLQMNILNNPLLNYIYALLVLFLGILTVQLIKSVVIKRLRAGAEATASKVDDLIVNGIRKSLVPLAYVCVLYLSVKFLDLPPFINRAIDILATILVVFFGIRFLLPIIIFSFDSYLAKKEKYEERKRLYAGLYTIIKFLVWALAFILLLDNFGVKITPLLAGIGIGGAAVALASQAILGDLFNYFVILFDRPFEVGDFIIVDNFMGTVEEIGIKTTKVRSLGGEQLIFSNSNLTQKPIKNYKRMQKRRVLFQIGVVYQTPLEKLREIPIIIRSIIEGIEDTIFDRAHFFSYGDFSLIFEVVYYVIGNDYNKYMDIQQEINLKIYEEFQRRGIEFAYPTQTVYLVRQN